MGHSPDMLHTLQLAEAHSRAVSALEAARVAVKCIARTLEVHIQHTGACHICDGTGEVLVDRLVECGCGDRLCGCACGNFPIHEQVREACPYGCDPAPAPNSPDDFAF